MLTSKIIQTVEHPDEPGVTFTLRKLSYRQCDEAENAQRERVLGVMRHLDGITLPDSPEALVEAERKSRDPKQKYDRATVLRYGIAAWTYDEPCDDANKDDLDEDTAAWAFDAIMAHSLRSAAEGEASASVSTPASA